MRMVKMLHNSSGTEGKVHSEWLFTFRKDGIVQSQMDVKGIIIPRCCNHVRICFLLRQDDYRNTLVLILQ